MTSDSSRSDRVSAVFNRGGINDQLRTPAGRPGGVNVHLYPSPLTHESRMMRICGELDRMGLFDSVLAVGIAKAGLAEHETVTPRFALWRLPRLGESFPGLLGRVIKTLAWSWSAFFRLRGLRLTCINCHSLALLPLCVLLKLRHRSRLIYDTHELETETTSMRGIRKPIMRLLERSLISSADEVCVVSEGIAEWYRHSYRLARVSVVRNLPISEANLEQGTDRAILRFQFGIPDDHLIFLYIGVLGRGRRIEQLLRIFQDIPPDRHLVLIGYGPLVAECRTAADHNPNVHFLPAVAPEDVHRYAVGADVGIQGGENLCLSYFLSLPNKLFQYMRAGVAVLANDWPEIRNVVAETQCGWVVGPDEASWKARIWQLTWKEIQTARIASLRAAKAYTWDADTPILHAIYWRLYPGIESRMTMR